MGKSKQLDSKVVHFDREKDPYGFIQWKGTDVCMDSYCECGYHFHIDGDFACYVRCPACGAFYEVGCFVRLFPCERPDASHYTDNWFAALTGSGQLGEWAEFVDSSKCLKEK